MSKEEKKKGGCKTPDNAAACSYSDQPDVVVNVITDTHVESTTNGVTTKTPLSDLVGKFNFPVPFN